ncbi:MAG: DUF86 domain-containing protein [Spirochaetia bacterium]
MVDRILVLRKLDQLEAYGRQLSEFKNISLQQYREDWKAQRIVERTLQIMIETCVDITNHVIADSRMRAPKSYADSFTVLQEKGIISKEIHAQLVGMAKFRNVIVHQYDEIDAAIVISILRNHELTFDQFRAQILGFLHHPRSDAMDHA